MNFSKSKVRSFIGTQGIVFGLLSFSCADTEFKADSRQAATQDATAAELPGTPLTPSESTLPAAISKKPDAISASFPASLTKDESLKFTLDLRGVTTEFKLNDINKPLSDERSQITRPPTTQMAKQGTPGTDIQETFDQQAKKGLLDILVVIDNSGSMENEQANLSNKLSELLVSVANSDWQLGVITTNASKELVGGLPKCFMTLIKSTDLDPMGDFKNAVVKAGISGDGNEQGILQAVVGLSCLSQPWLRANASLAVLILSDEDNCSADGSGCPNKPWQKETFLIDHVEKTLGKVIGKNAGFYGIFSPPATPCNTAVNVGTQYQRLVNYKAAGAMNFGNICDASYATTLNRISANISNLLKSQFELKNVPSPNTLKLNLQLSNGSQMPLTANDFSLQDKTISFAAGKEPPANSKLVADYKVGVIGLFSSLTLNNDPAPETVKVKINGQPAAADAFTLIGRQLNFATQPPALADITVDYRVNIPLTDRFVLLKSPLANSLNVSVDGTPTTAFSFDAAKNEVRLANPPIDGAKILFNLTFREAPQLAYSLPLGAGATDFLILDDKTPVSFTRSDAVFTIAESQHQAGKLLKLQYQMPDNSAKVFILDHTPIQNTADISATSPNCDVGMGIELQGNTLTANCAVTAKTEFTLNYKYREVQTKFKLPSVLSPDKGKWEVFINGEATTDFERSGSTLSLNFEPELDSKITIQYTLPE